MCINCHVKVQLLVNMHKPVSKGGTCKPPAVHPLIRHWYKGLIEIKSR